MPIRSDLTIDVAKLQLEAVSESTKKANDHLMTLLDGEPKWFEVIRLYMMTEYVANASAG